MSEIVIKPDQMAVAKGEAVLITMALGSSLAVCMYDEEGGIGGLVHTLLPDIRREGNGKNGLRYVDTATRALFEAMKEAGAVPERIRVKLVGGAKIFCFAGQAGQPDIGRENVSCARKMLQELDLAIVSEDTGENYGRSVHFMAGSGRLEIETVPDTGSKMTGGRKELMRKMKNMKIGKKLMVSYGIIIIFYIITVIVSLFGVYNVSKSLDVFYNKAFTASYTAGNLRASVQSIGRTILSIATEGTNVDRQEQLDEIDEILRDMDTNLTMLKEQMPDNDLVNQLRESLKDQKQSREAVIEELKNGSDEEAISLYGSDFEPKAEKTRECLEAITAYSRVNAEKYLDRGHEVRQQMTAVILVLSFLILMITVALCLYITKGITEPVSEVREAAKNLAEGNLKVQLKYQSEDELRAGGQLPRDHKRFERLCVRSGRGAFGGWQRKAELPSGNCV